METLAQYEDRIAREYLGANPDITQREYISCYPRGCRFTMWAKEIEQAAGRGEVLPARILDELYRWSATPGLFLRFLRDNPTAIPRGYLNPGARQINKEQP